MSTVHHFRSIVTRSWTRRDLENRIKTRRAARGGKLSSRNQLARGGGRNPAFRTHAPRTFCAKFDIERSSANAAFSMARRAQARS
jgi:hypothetical protein